MIVSILQENLAHAIAVVQRAVAAKSTMPVLGCILLKTAGGSLEVSATNLEIAIKHTAAAQVKKAGMVAIPARQLSDYVNTLPPDRIDLELNTKTQTLKLKCANYQANIKGIDADEFPAIPTFEKKDAALIEPDLFRTLIARALVSVATDDSRPVMRCALAEFNPAALNLVTADGFRLTHACAPMERALPKPTTVLIPAPALQEIARLAAKMEEQIAVSFSANGSQAFFDFGDTSLVANLGEGNFLDYRQIIPTQHSTRALCNTAELVNSIRAAMVFARDASNIVRLKLEAETQGKSAQLTVFGQSESTGDAQNSIETELDGDGLEIAFNGKFLLDALAVGNAPQTAFELLSPEAPGVLKPVGNDTFTYVLMPMHIRGMKKPI